MKLLGFEIGRASKPQSVEKADCGYVPSGRGWWPIVSEPFGGAWQRNIEWKYDSVVTFSAVYRCISLISTDIAKLRVRLMQRDSSGIWQETTSPAYTPVLRKPNHFQTRIQFYENWMQSKLSVGNTYVLKERDSRNVVTGLYVLDPTRVRPLITESGDVYYDLATDCLAGIQDQIIVPAAEVIHDRWNTLYHPLVGTSPLTACGLAAMQGLAIQNNSTKFFENASRPGGVLTAPGRISDDNAQRLKELFEQNFSGGNAGRVAVLGDGLTFQTMSITAEDAQMIEQLKWSAETVAGTFGVPAYKAGVAEPPSYNNIGALNDQYYQQCLQIHFESIELGLREGLDMPAGYEASFDLDGLLRMDQKSQVETASEGVRAAIFSPNEARSKFQLPPVEGGETPWIQQQNWPLNVLADRPAETPQAPAVQETPPSTEDENAVTEETVQAGLLEWLEKDVERLREAFV